MPHNATPPAPTANGAEGPCGLVGAVGRSLHRPPLGAIANETRSMPAAAVTAARAFSASVCTSAPCAWVGELKSMLKVAGEGLTDAHAGSEYGLSSPRGEDAVTTYA